jgi:hypothetical protein
LTDEDITRRRVVVTSEPSVAMDRPESTTVQPEFLSKATVARNRQKPRSQELLDAIARIDTEPNALAAQQIMEWVRAHYEERAGGEILGLFSKCYLGPPYVDHIMNVTGFICEHFRVEDTVPGAYSLARNLAANDAYEYIEVYSDGALVPVRSDGKAL